jgi:hypothetical protein
MMERKWLMLVIGIIVGLVVGAGLGYSSTLGEIAKLRDENDQLRLQFESLNATHNTLNATYTWLRQHSFTYYIVGNDINVSNVGIFKNPWWLDWTINGTVTNISDKPIKTIYVYVIFVNPNGTKEFSPYRYAVISDLYIGETATFSVNSEVYQENQTIELFLVY